MSASDSDENGSDDGHTNRLSFDSLPSLDRIPQLLQQLSVDGQRSNAFAELQKFLHDDFYYRDDWNTLIAVVATLLGDQVLSKDAASFVQTLSTKAPVQQVCDVLGAVIAVIQRNHATHSNTDSSWQQPCYQTLISCLRDVAVRMYAETDKLSNDVLGALADLLLRKQAPSALQLLGLWDIEALWFSRLCVAAPARLKLLPILRERGFLQYCVDLVTNGSDLMEPLAVAQCGAILCEVLATREGCIMLDAPDIVMLRVLRLPSLHSAVTIHSVLLQMVEYVCSDSDAFTQLLWREDVLCLLQEIAQTAHQTYAAVITLMLRRIAYFSREGLLTAHHISQLHCVFEWIVGVLENTGIHQQFAEQSVRHLCEATAVLALTDAGSEICAQLVIPALQTTKNLRVQDELVYHLCQRFAGTCLLAQPPQLAQKCFDVLFSRLASPKGAPLCTTFSQLALLSCDMSALVKFLVHALSEQLGMPDDSPANSLSVVQLLNLICTTAQRDTLVLNPYTPLVARYALPTAEEERRALWSYDDVHYVGLRLLLTLCAALPTRVRVYSEWHVVQKLSVLQDLAAVDEGGSITIVDRCSVLRARLLGSYRVVAGPGELSTTAPSLLIQDEAAWPTAPIVAVPAATAVMAQELVDACSKPELYDRVEVTTSVLQGAIAGDIASQHLSSALAQLVATLPTAADAGRSSVKLSAEALRYTADLLEPYTKALSITMPSDWRVAYAKFAVQCGTLWPAGVLMLMVAQSQQSPSADLLKHCISWYDKISSNARIAALVAPAGVVLWPLLRDCERLVRTECPQLDAYLQHCSTSVAAVCGAWLRQSFVNIMDWRDIVAVWNLTLLHGSQALVWTCVALLWHRLPVITQYASTVTHDDTVVPLLVVLLDPAVGFSLAGHLDRMLRWRQHQ
eukprot:TRINITY_DN12603_c0_g1_i1.p1 TRINITY_DN12603_c0_g1~~TRINITY_DN12603_c0_g1_i1.p1  ORF type:complete len:909 (+),score=190.80 TRINITY_DN12603_c0_g1_i1:125-2851(+)